ncbi:extracellular solute-binding protein [Thermomonospora cellulosilytica]|uniref:Raffinose/stachyose/melibiose transport system substrate-binding protein/xylobiose transport system substrate-binding protein n=1 Tax=Thermomonospora cellulosilytica TaxID=1411118 RepID=A0A7W3R6G3_9ACTN|nr:extracellular solute-binding protein [Thermomonospora cellulosilytica]MBA9001592.1 raffinose/stachyose/melibiose transport system substrate-binding protein/xylobiose transport system substrate-binding protein [Thermomonospora cellulosilytica]
MLRVRRRARYLALVAASALALSACGSSGPAGGGSGEVRVWSLQDGVNRAEREAVAAYNKSADPKVKMETFLNDPYKQKLQVAMGSPQAPDVFMNWGGGNLKQYVDAGQVHDLTGALNADPAWRDRFLPVVMKTAQINGKYYGVPERGMQPIVLFYNKDVFAKAGQQPPKTWDDLLRLVDVFKDRGVTPFALAGSQAWTELMWLEYLLDRIGGPAPFQAIVERRPGAWKDPSVLRALTMIRELVDRGAFGTNYASVDYDVGGASTIFAQGKAAMHLMGSWEYATQLEQNPDFVKKDRMGWTAFPSVPGGQGDPKNIVGNPSNYMSVSAGSKDKEAAVRFLKEGLTSDAYIRGMISVGEVPAIKGVEPQLRSGPAPEYGTFIYGLVSGAPNFTQSWDQALPPNVAEAMLTNLSKLFLKDITPQQFADAMDKIK